MIPQYPPEGGCTREAHCQLGDASQKVDAVDETHHHQRVPVNTDTRPQVLRRLNYIEGHLHGVRRMIEDDRYCVDVLKQTYAVRKAIEKLEALILESHLNGCVVQGIKEGREGEVVSELLELYESAGR